MCIWYSALLLFPISQKKRTPPKRGGGRGSAGSSRTGSRPGTPSIDNAATSNTLRAAANKLEQGTKKGLKKILIKNVNKMSYMI